MAGEHEDVTYCCSSPACRSIESIRTSCIAGALRSLETKSGRPPTREGASDNLAPGSAGGTTVNKEGGRAGGRYQGMARYRRDPKKSSRRKQNPRVSST